MSKQHFIETEEELKQAAEETIPCPYCNIINFKVNCGLDCIYHIPKPETKSKQYCRCTNPLLAGTIETGNYCSYKKRSIMLEVDNNE